jgi:predicted RNA-binding Zn-ribbon protein involved in translation (DUF1610 family)
MSGEDAAKAVAAVVGVVLFIWSLTRRRDKWGLNTRSTDCPNCGEPVARIRHPRSLAQAMWGGYTCAKCGTEMDKWGRKVES